MKKLIFVSILCSSLIALTQEKNKNSGVPNSSPNSVSSASEDEMKFEDSLKSLDYPELQVVPRASERLATEAGVEREQKVLALWPFYASAVSTIAFANLHNGKYRQSDLTDSQKKESDNAATAGYAIGGGWLAVTAFLSFREPLSEAQVRVSKYRGAGKRLDLTRERMAEEALQEQAELMKKLTWLSLASNLAVDGYMLSLSHQDIRYMGGIAIIASLLPAFFENHSVSVWQKHQDYKRRIYSPVVSFQWNKGELTPLLVSAWTF